jgi:hypothetical protein
MWSKVIVIVCLASILLCGCASVPKESVELSVTVGRDLAEIHRSHRALAVLYFGTIKDDIGRFVDEVYRPYIIKSTMADFQLVESIQSYSESSDLPDPLMLLDVFVSEVTAEIESFRALLLQPIAKHETDVLLAIDESYQAVQNANAIVTGHLASIRKVHDAQEEALRMAGLGGLREELVDETARLSNRIATLTDQGMRAEGDIEKTVNTIDELKDAVDSVLSGSTP